MKKDTSRVLVIGDTHEPACLDEYLEFCKDLKKKYKITHTIHIGDEMDVHAANFHDHDPDGLSAGDELELTIKRLARWHKAFPGADVVIGNHTRMFTRRAFHAGIPARVLRNLKDILEVPTWTYANSFKYDNVRYIHGEGVTARTKAMRTGCSTVQGHRHSESYVHYNENGTFGMQVGCGVDAEHYAMVYAKDGPAQILSAGVVLDNGTLPIVIPMI